MTKEVARMCLRNQISVLFANPIVELRMVRNPAFYQDDYVIIQLRIERDHSNFFVLQYPKSGDIVITKGLDYVPKNFGRIFFTDLLFDHLSNLHSNLNTDPMQPSIEKLTLHF